MNRTIHRAALIGIALILSLTTLTNCRYETAHKEQAASETRAAGSSKEHPGFPLPDLKGKLLAPEDYRGKVVFVNFWATWCPPCRQEIPDFIEVYKQYHDQGFEILGVALDDEGAQVVKPFAAEVKINYPVLIGNDKIVEAYNVQGIPTTLVLDRQGKVYTRLVGPRRRADLEALIKSLL